ncbi:peptide methionine sulfoxide reductase [Rahnella aquatilis CIP 78.65 = ATCC 33071]|uniref:Peptide methionine sulfoxide reductase MsrA n=1 Tax=Rahnella aquatilis (strain ATCC 33071 / DSM 4594 / JCM 1683 / NBRC 105701 / NCIMB 13365 / CIP 78.65) TaxID=745277 RepID=H2J1A6_RAHAC|nr:peptide-methionine (S)-S-oxide reductase MsrA [Rahnella aquatilis]AEX54353.1 methionine-S-sulfoxide reductase [Rahnella aquatilis CIP 78.65 = ATCC 33071]KFC99753.1 peptide methionine sulfoxide reductase [Rahnella aquatilis CIP 78.65 = ATCC 33071]
MKFASKNRRNFRHYSLIAGLMLASAFVFENNAWSWGAGAEPAVVIPAPAKDEPAGTAHSETALFAGGCFWGIQGVFQHVKGVTSAVSGYTGGAAQTARYEQVSTGETGHAESVKVTFDPTQVTYGELLQIFFSVGHNPTELNRQGPDTGSQYRSAVFPLSAAQAEVAKAYIAQLDASHSYNEPLVTKVESHAHFYPAEAYHQNFLNDNPDYPYIVVNDLPKIKYLKQYFPAQYREQPVLVKE